ncbi:uncharacterized protein PADG_00900 [Paracoccidioides brasiliensis Pb18]|uniref:Uncharacterized protein n=1 Tax=Paracoccidioides brasiliensis (strain Pb18) TaxID=502780 RepID=C1FYM4_PARBD|nr:uncharacterized protein PADG_00900 [Paracoccidioides brasiliensis Pb18]EEH44611.1 hypothetical protein PADG_00900 [Paracoccidioides brasiliensis Pb18]ODH49421.1 hypothetical protein GX48_04506 [Paracoccidioides brasiliensis]
MTVTIRAIASTCLGSAQASSPTAPIVSILARMKTTGHMNVTGTRPNAFPRLIDPALESRAEIILRGVPLPYGGRESHPPLFPLHPTFSSNSLAAFAGHSLSPLRPLTKPARLSTTNGPTHHPPPPTHGPWNP